MNGWRRLVDRRLDTLPHNTQTKSPHAAWTDGAPMRAIVVELPGPLIALAAVEGAARPVDPASAGPRVARGEGGLAPRRPAPRQPADEDGAEGEPV